MCPLDVADENDNNNNSKIETTRMTVAGKVVK
jgi:hypothetical protein